MANPGWREEKSNHSRQLGPGCRLSKPLRQSLVLPPPVWRGGKDGGWRGGSALASEEELSMQICPTAGLSASPEPEESATCPPPVTEPSLY